MAMVMERTGADYMKSSPSKRNSAPQTTHRKMLTDERGRCPEFLTTNSISPHAKNGELPLFFPTVSQYRPIAMSEQPHSQSQVTELNSGQSLRQSDAGWPLASHEISSWASSFRFEMDPQDGECFKAMLTRDEPSFRDFCSGRMIGKQSPAERSAGTPGGSFSFRDGFEELNGRQFEFLKPSRQLEKHHGSTRFVGFPTPLTDETQGSETLQRHPHKLNRRDNRPLEVTISPERGEVLQKLCNLKANGLRMDPDGGGYSKEKVAPSPVRGDIHPHPSLKSSTPSKSESLKTSCTPPSRTSITREQLVSNRSPRNPQQSIRGELEIMPTTEERRSPLGTPSRLRGDAFRQESVNPEPLSTPSRIRDGERRAGNSIQEQIVIIRKQSLALTSTVKSPSPDHTPLVSAAVPFKWEEEPGKPKSISASAQRALARKSSKEESNLSLIEKKLGSQPAAARHSTEADRCRDSPKSETGGGKSSPRRSSADICQSDSGQTGSHRYYSRAHFRGHSREPSWGRSSTRYSTHEKESIDLIASAAAKFLVEPLESPASTPGRHASSPIVSVPFKWEDVPGKAKVDTVVSKPHALQLPPRLAVPLHRGSDSFSNELRASYFSHPLAGLFSPCMTASSPVRKLNDSAGLMQYGGSKSLPPKAPSPLTRHARHGFVGHCNSSPQEGCQIRVSKSFDKSSNLSTDRGNKAFSGPLPTTNSPVMKPRKLFSSELKPSHPWMLKSNSAVPSSPTSILCGPDEGSSQTSASNMFSSGDLDAYAHQTTTSGKSQSKSSSSASYESIEENFDDLESSSYNLPLSFESHPFRESQGTPARNLDPSAEQISGREHFSYRSRGPSEGVKSLLKLCKHGNCLGKPKSKQRLGTIYSPEVWAPTLATYFQCLELNENATSSGLLDQHGAPTSSGYLNCRGEPRALNESPLDQPEKNYEKLSPERPTRLPYTMPTVVEQELAARDLCKAPSVDFDARLGGKKSASKLTPSRSGASTPARVEMFLISTAQASHREEACPSPAYAAALELLSPAVNLMTQRRKGTGIPKVPATKWPGPKARKRVRFIMSICKTLKRVLFRQQHRKPSAEPKLMYHDELAPTAFQFSKPN